jgi:hypothetical protein
MILTNPYSNIRICNILDIPSILLNGKITYLLYYLIYQFSFLSLKEFKEEYKSIGYNSIKEIYLDNFNIIQSLNYFIVVVYNIYTLEILGGCLLDKVDDLRFKNKLYPWLCNLNIKPSLRNKGISKKLINKFDETCINKKESRYYLYCKKSLVKYYHKLNYKYLFTFNQNGKIKYVFYSLNRIK